ncbi:MAG TPA: hypothetical protein VGV40_05720 [Solirubrobacteraceae bacterium]|nr:hypothetical protein [Solirubrobacteraceae bacterium]
MPSVPRPDARSDERRLAASRAGIGFALLNVPLGAVAVAADWRTTVDAPLNQGPAAESFLLRGTALSGPVPPVVLTGALGLLARRHDRWGLAATGLLGAMGLFITINGARQALARPAAHSPRPVLVAGGAIFTALGLRLTAASGRALAAHRDSAAHAGQTP